MTLPCCCHAVVVPLPCRCHDVAALLPCRCHAVAVLLPCHCHTVEMPLPCRCHVVAMSLPCRGHAVAMPWSCRCHDVAMLLWPYCCHVVARHVRTLSCGERRAATALRYRSRRRNVRYGADQTASCGQERTRMSCTSLGDSAFGTEKTSVSLRWMKALRIRICGSLAALQFR